MGSFIIIRQVGKESYITGVPTPSSMNSSPPTHPLTHSAPATLASSQLLKYTRHIPPPGPLHWPFPLPRTPFRQIPTCLAPSPPDHAARKSNLSGPTPTRSPPLRGAFFFYSTYHHLNAINVFLLCLSNLRVQMCLLLGFQVLKTGPGTQ